jgi:hypothetical protein
MTSEIDVDGFLKLPTLAIIAQRISALAIEPHIVTHNYTRVHTTTVIGYYRALNWPTRNKPIERFNYIVYITL